MLSGLKFIPRDEIDRARDKDLDEFGKERKKLGSRKSKDRRKKRKSGYNSSDEDLERIKKGKKKKWYASDEDLSPDSDVASDSEYASDYHENKCKSKGRKEKEKRQNGLEDKSKKEKRSRRRDYSSEENSSYYSESGKSDREERHDREGKKRRNKDGGDISRKERGLEWMLRPKDSIEQTPASVSDNQTEEVRDEEIKKVNPRELNPYLKNNGSGYPEESDGTNAGKNQLLSSAIVGDGGASWRLKALKRAQEQAAREGRKLDKVVEERWGSLGQLAVSVASHKAAPTHAHLHAIKSRRRGQGKEEQTETSKQNKTNKSDSSHNAEMRVPKVQDSLSWRKRRMSMEDINLSAAMSSINKFSNDGSFMHDFMRGGNDDSGDLLNSSNAKTKGGEELKVAERSSEDAASMQPALSANQLAAKALQLRMKGKHEKAEKLLKEAENKKLKPDAGDDSYRPRIDGSTIRYIMHDMSAREKMKEEDADLHLAQKIMGNQRYSVANRADDEYDYDDGPRRKVRKKVAGDDHRSSEITKHASRILTQQERCQFCFENPKRPKHLVVAIANFTYLSLPHWEPIVPGHCYILTMQHESATRTVDNNIWEEIRNFKKCLLMMFAKQEKDLVFLETVMGLAQQRRHCLVECIPLPREVAKQGPLYFKKAIDEAEEEWSQHNAKKLIDTSEKGLRASIPKNFPYFHVEFGLNKGFVHVIDDENQFKSNFGLNVIRGMLRLPAEDMHGRRKRESVEMQKEVAANFARDWEPFDWTKQLD